MTHDGWDNSKHTQLNSLKLMEYIIRKPMNKETKTYPADAAVEKLHKLKEQIENE